MWICPRPIAPFGRLPLSTGTAELLKEWLPWVKKKETDAWLFATEKGTRLPNRDFMWTGRIQPAVEPLGLEWATFQVMRRTHASLSRRRALMLIPGRLRWETQLT